MDKAGVIAEVLKLSGLCKDDIFRRDRSPGTVKAKALYCYLMREKAGARGIELMKELALSSGAISHLYKKGRVLTGGY